MCAEFGTVLCELAQWCAKFSASTWDGIWHSGWKFSILDRCKICYLCHKLTVQPTSCLHKLPLVTYRIFWISPEPSDFHLFARFIWQCRCYIGSEGLTPVRLIPRMSWNRLFICAQFLARLMLVAIMEQSLWSKFVLKMLLQLFHREHPQSRQCHTSETIMAPCFDQISA